MKWFGDNDSWIVHPPDPTTRNRWWLIALIIFSGPLLALVCWLLGA